MRPRRPGAVALERKGPSFMALSRQNLPVLDPEKHGVFEGVAQGRLHRGGGRRLAGRADGGYGLGAVAGAGAAEQLKKDGITVRVVSMPSLRLLEEQSEEYKRVGLSGRPAEAGG